MFTKEQFVEWVEAEIEEAEGKGFNGAAKWQVIYDAVDGYYEDIERIGQGYCEDDPILEAQCRQYNIIDLGD